MSPAGLQTLHGPTGERLTDLAQRRQRHRYLCCQLMSGVYSSAHYTVGEQGSIVCVCVSGQGAVGNVGVIEVYINEERERLGTDDGVNGRVFG